MNFFRFSLTFSVLLYAVAVPVLEKNSTHVFNPHWTPHVRIHEVWQLLTNSSIGILCLWLTWKERKYILASALSLIVTVSFLTAYSMQNLYGGAMKFVDGSEKVLFGINIGVLGFGLAVLFLFLGLFNHYKFSSDSKYRKEI